MKIPTYVSLITLAMIGLFSCGRKDLDTVEDLNLTRYMGTWYEIARLPNRFEKGLECVTATYSLRGDGKIKVLNLGRKSENHEEVKKITGVAWVPDSKAPGRLKVQFFWPFAGKYWVLYIDQDYQTALVGDPSRKYLWVLSRTPFLKESILKNLLNRAEDNGFRVDKMVFVNQDCLP
jgi:apolipoprotein D and lipocalin family protein